jgi:hypothetical protein
MRDNLLILQPGSDSRSAFMEVAASDPFCRETEYTLELASSAGVDAASSGANCTISSVCIVRGAGNVRVVRGLDEHLSNVGLGGIAMTSLRAADTRHGASGDVTDLIRHPSYPVVRA